MMAKAGLLNESLQYALDYEYWIRLALLGARFKRLDRAVARFQLSQSSKTVGQTTSHALELLRTFEGSLLVRTWPRYWDWQKTGFAVWSGTRGRAFACRHFMES
jgi:hypothetical protein